MDTPDALRVVSPLTVTPAMLVSSDVPETDYPEWVAGTTYAKDARVIVVAQHKVYQSTKDANTGNTPVGDSGANWLEVGATNRWKVFDQSITSQTARASQIQYRIKPGRAISALSALNISGATSMRVRVIDSTYGVAYDRTVSLSRIPVATGWYPWYFGDRATPTQGTLFDLPSLPTADIEITFTGNASLAVGTLLLGQQRVFAVSVRMGARIGIQDYSRKDVTAFGDTVIVERNFARRGNFDLLILAREVDELNNFLAANRAKLCLWIASTRYEATTIYGIWQNFDIVINYYTHSDCSLEILGVT